MDRLQAMRVFISVLDQRSLSAAAKKLQMSLPTVSRVLAGLEKELGVRLIARTTRGLSETDVGRLYYRRCRQILDEVRETEAAVLSHAKAPAGELRVTAPVTFGRHHVAPAVATFLERYPRISCYLLLSDHCEVLAEQRLDVAIRVAQLRDENLAARRLGFVQRAVVGSPRYFAKHPLPRHPRELTRHDCLHFTHYLRSDEWNFLDQGKLLTVKVRGRLRANNQEALIDAILAGAGLAILPTWLTREYLEDGRLQRVLAKYEAPRTPVHAIFPTQGAPPKKVRTFVDFLSDRFREQDVLKPEATA